MNLCRPLAILLVALPAFATVVDPGPRGGPAAAGGTFESVNADDPPTILDFFTRGSTVFQEADGVEEGLGPRYNALSCASCHAHPAVGGSSPSVNPQVAAATADGATNTVPSFITSSGPVREARFIYFTDGSGDPIPTQPNGGVMPLYTIAGRSDADTCTSTYIQQPDFATNLTNDNISFRIPTPLFGLGLVENIEDSELQTVLVTHYTGPYYVGGTFNRSPNDGTISRFGWKAQNKSLELFSGEAYNVEQGVSNELFTQERPSPEENRDQGTGLAVQCRLNATPEDHTNIAAVSFPEETPSDVTMFAIFMRLLAPPVQDPGTPLSNPNYSRVLSGESVFIDIGCNSCHRDVFTAEESTITPDMSGATARLFSDLEIHHMGSGLADNIVQGNAGADQFRTAPLWGLGQRLFFLHDGRATTLMDAITAHQSTGSEANSVILNYNALSDTSKQDLIYYLRSL